jgi:hypothetical protein
MAPIRGQSIEQTSLSGRREIRSEEYRKKIIKFHSFLRNKLFFNQE